MAAIRSLAALSHGLDARDYLGRTPLHYAAMHGRVAALEELLALGADLGQKDLRGGYTGGWRSLPQGWTVGCAGGRAGAVRVVCGDVYARQGADCRTCAVRRLSCSWPAALHLAADAGQCDSVSRLVALGAPVDALSNKAHTPLQLALLKVRRSAVWHTEQVF